METNDIILETSDTFFTGQKRRKQHMDLLL